MPTLTRFLFETTATWRVALTILGGIIGGLAGAATIAAIHAGLQPHPRPYLVFVFAGVWILTVSGRAVAEVLLLRVVLERGAALRNTLARRIIAAPLRVIERAGTARLLTTLTEDVSTIIAATSALLAIGPQVAILLGVLGYMAWLSPTLFLCALLPLAVGIATFRFFDNIIRRSSARQRAMIDEMVKNFAVVTDGVKEMKLHRDRREAFLNDLLSVSVHKVAEYGRRAATVHFVNTQWANTLYMLGIAFVIFVVPRSEGSSAGVVTGFTLATLYLSGPLSAVLNCIPQLNRAQIALRHVAELEMSLTEEREGVAPPGALPGLEKVRRAWSSLELRHIEYTYEQSDGRAFGVGPIDLELRPGELVFLIGGNGSGKTTFAKLLTGLYTPSSGQRLVNGTPVAPGEEDDYRQHFAAVYSDAFLFDRLLALAPLEGEAREYLRLLELQDKVTIKDGRLSTVALSQGQRKRLMLMFAWLEDRPIYVFDEWAADQDPHFRDIFYTKFLPDLKARGKAVVVITHDDRYFGCADRLLKLDCGRVTAARERASARVAARAPLLADSGSPS